MEESTRRLIDDMVAKYPMFAAEQIEEYHDLFRAYDRDGDNTIDIAELGSIFHEIGLNYGEEQIKRIIDEIDADRTGRIEFDEFLDLMSRKTLTELMQEDYSDADESEANHTPKPEDDSERVYTVPELRRHIEVIKALQRGLGVRADDAGGGAGSGSPLSSASVPVVASSGGADGDGDDATPRNPAADDGAEETPEDHAIEVPDAVKSLQEAQLLHYAMAQHVVAKHLNQMGPDDWNHESLCTYMAEVLRDLEERLFEETGYDLVHCEDADVGVVDDEAQFTVEDAQLIERNLDNFAFACKKDPSLALGTEAFVLHASSNPYASIPKRMILPRVSDEAVVERHGFLDLNAQSLNDRYAFSVAEVIRRDAARPAHKEADLRGPPLIRHVEVQRNFLTPAGGSAILSAMTTRGCKVHHVDLSHNDLGKRAVNIPHGDTAVQHLAALERELALRAPRNPAAHGADGCDSCSEWKRHRGFGSVVRDVLSGTSALASLKVLRLTYDNLGDLEVTQLCEGLADNGQLYELDLSHNNLGYQSAIALADMLASNGDLRVLKVGWNRLTAAGTNHLMKEGLLQNGTLEEVDLSWTGVQDLPSRGDGAAPTPGVKTVDSGGKLLGKVIGGLFLKRLSASHNAIGADGAAAIAAALKTNSTLVSLSLSHNPLTTDGVRDILKAVKDNTTVEELDLSATSSGAAVKGSRFSEEMEAELLEIQEKKRAQKGRGGGGGDGGPRPPAPWQAWEYHRHSCLVYCPQCDMKVRSTRLHDEQPNIDHRLDARKTTDPTSLIAELKTKIAKIQCTQCQLDQPPNTSCTQCGVMFCGALRPTTVRCPTCDLEQAYGKQCTKCEAPLPHPSGITHTFAAQNHDAHCRYPSPPGPERGYLPDDIPKTFQVVSTRMREIAAMKPKDDKKKGDKGKGGKEKGKGKKK